ncbi:MAG: hypothetical protein AAFP84_15780, partial [Actinomycetota bacterium]
EPIWDDDLLDDGFDDDLPPPEPIEQLPDVPADAEVWVAESAPLTSDGITRTYDLPAGYYSIRAIAIDQQDVVLSTDVVGQCSYVDVAFAGDEECVTEFAGGQVTVIIEGYTDDDARGEVGIEIRG